MNAEHLSPRLLRVAEYVPKGSRLLDIGSDHAYLPIYLVKHGIVDRAIASEVAKGPFNNMRREVLAYRVQGQITLRLANGLHAVTPRDRINVITIAGMGGTLIKNILAQGSTILKAFPKLILQPNVGADKVRKWLMQNGYQITNESILADDHRIYEIIVADRAQRPIHYDVDQLRFGPLLLKHQNAAFITKWRDEAKHLQTVTTQMERAKRKPIARIKEMNQMIKHIKEILQK